MVTVALREFRAVGLNLTVMLQLAPPASVAPHALVNRKSPGFVPPKVMVIGSAALPRLLKVIVRELLVVPTLCEEKVIEVGDTETAVPVPVRLTVDGLVGAEWRTVSVACRWNAAVGRNETSIRHVDPALRLVPHVVVRMKSAGLAPSIVMPVIDSDVVPVFRKVTRWEELVVPINRVAKVSDVGERVADGAVMPVPDSGTVRGLPVPLSVMVSVALLVPVEVGAKVTDIVHDAPAASDGPQRLASENWPGLVPPSAAPLIVSVVEPPLVRVTTRGALAVLTAWFPNASDVGETVTGPLLLPLPESGTVCGLPGALLAMLSVAERVPAAVGVKVTVIVHEAPAASVDPQVVVRAKSPALVPVMLVPLMVNEADPVLVRVTVRGALVVPTAWAAKTSVEGFSETAAAPDASAARCWKMARACW